MINTTRRRDEVNIPLSTSIHDLDLFSSDIPTKQQQYHHNCDIRVERVFFFPHFGV